MGKSFLFNAFLVFLTPAFLAGCYDRLEFAGGFQGGTYSQIGESLNIIESIEVNIRDSAGSRENIGLLKAGEVDLAMAQFR